MDFNILNNILQLEEYFLLEDKNMIINSLNFASPKEILENAKSFVRMTFLSGGDTKENIISKNEIKKYYFVFKLYYEDFYIILLVNKNDLNNNYNNNNDTNILINKINNIKYFRGVIRIKFNIREYPLYNYYLEEKQFNNEIDIDKIFILKNKNKNNPFNRHTMSMNENSITHLLNENNLLVYNNLNKDEKIKYLEKLLKEGKNKINELKEKLARYPFELLPGERMMSIIFSSLTQNVHYSVICKNTDIFVNVELKLYKDYPEYKKGENNYFTVNGRIIDKYKSLQESGIKNSDVILINIKDTSMSK